MEDATTLKTKSMAELEDWFMTAVGGDNPPHALLFDVLRYVVEQGDWARAEGLAEIFQESLATSRREAESLHLLRIRAAWRSDAAFRTEARRLIAGFHSDRLGQAFIKAAGLEGEGLPVAEALRRFEALALLKPGALCLDRTWGFGVVNRLDDFYQKIVVDFDGKPGHAMSFTYAGETLALIGDDHLMARRHRDPAGFQALVADQPGEIVRLALKSYGPLTVGQLTDLLVPRIVPEAGWKKFWDGARKALKGDTLVEIPAKRTEPLRLLDKARAFDGDWFARLARERDADRVFEALASLAEGGDAVLGDPAHLRIVGDRLTHAALGYEDREYARLAQTLLLATRFDRARTGFDFARFAVRLTRTECLRICSDMPSRDFRRALTLVHETHAASLQSGLLAVLHDLTMPGLGEAVDYLLGAGREADCQTIFRGELSEHQAAPDMLVWLARNLDRLEAWRLGRVALLLHRMIEVLGDASLLRTRARNVLEDQALAKGWIEDAIARMDDDERADLVRRIDRAGAWDAGNRRSLLARMIKVRPELQAVLAGVSAPTPAEEERTTSWRSYRERQRQLQHLVEVAIPQNSRDIASARSYGDLRENFEYHAAKDQQRILMQRQREMESDLKTVKGVEFGAGTPTAVAPGACVVLRRPDGREERVTILGEWDRDEALNIISGRSKLAQTLRGHKAGERVALPVGGDDSVTETCDIVAIEGLGEPIRAWLAQT